MSDAQQTPYDLTPEQTGAFLSLGNEIASAKLSIYQGNLALARAEAQFAGALAFLAQSKGIPGGKLSPDFTRFTPPQE